MIRHFFTHKRQIITWVSSKFILILLIVTAIQEFLSSTLLEKWSGFEFVHPTGMNTAPTDWLAILCFLFVLSTYKTYKIEDKHLPNCTQMTLACLASIGAVFVSFLATHPSDAVFQTMTEFILRHRVIGGPLVASYLASTMTIVFIPLCFLFFPLHFLRANRLKIFFIFIGLQFCLFVTVLEAVYHSFFSPYLLKTVVAIIHLFLQNVYADPARSILSANNFLVRVGPACSGLSFLILFISFFSYVLWSFSRKAQIQKIRAAIIFFTGILLMFLLNAFRIASIMILGTVAPNLAMNLFHSAVGAIMFFLFFLLFLPVMKKWVFVGHGRQ